MRTLSGMAATPSGAGQFYCIRKIRGKLTGVRLLRTRFSLGCSPVDAIDWRRPEFAAGEAR